jgi:thymidylate kinase
VNEHFNDNIGAISKGDTRLAESFFRWPGGRRYLENITLILLNTLAPHSTEKEEMYLGFVEVLDRMEQRIERQKEGQGIIEDAFSSSE